MLEVEQLAEKKMASWEKVHVAFFVQTGKHQNGMHSWSFSLSFSRLAPGIERFYLLVKKERGTWCCPHLTFFAEQARQGNHEPIWRSTQLGKYLLKPLPPPRFGRVTRCTTNQPTTKFAYD